MLKAPVYTSPLESCNITYMENGRERRMPEGLKRTQLCANDKMEARDACQGDSGGPLSLIHNG